MILFDTMNYGFEDPETRFARWGRSDNVTKNSKPLPIFRKDFEKFLDAEGLEKSLDNDKIWFLDPNVRVGYKTGEDFFGKEHPKKDSLYRISLVSLIGEGKEMQDYLNIFTRLFKEIDKYVTNSILNPPGEKSEYEKLFDYSKKFNQ